MKLKSRFYYKSFYNWLILKLILVFGITSCVEKINTSEIKVDYQTVTTLDDVSTFSIEENDFVTSIRTGKTLSELKYQLDLKQSDNFKKIVVLNTTATDFLVQLNQASNIVALLDYKSIKKSYPKNTFTSIVDSNLLEGFSLEKLISFNPDLIILNEFQYNKYKKLADKFNFLVMYEYLEPTLLSKLSYIQIFGEIFNKQKQAEQYYNQQKVELNQLSLKLKELNSGINLLQLNYFGSGYYVPNCNTSLANFLNTNNVSFYCEETEQGTAITKEQAIMAVEKSDYLLIFDWMENRTNPDEIIKSWNFPVSNKKIIYCNTINTRFYEHSITKPAEFIEDFQYVLQKGKSGKYFQIY